jgi:hypothetical protein
MFWWVGATVLGLGSSVYTYYLGHEAGSEMNILEKSQDLIFDSIDYRTWVLLGCGAWLWTNRNVRRNINITKQKRSKISQVRRGYLAYKDPYQFRNVR